MCNRIGGFACRSDDSIAPLESLRARGWILPRSHPGPVLMLKLGKLPEGAAQLSRRAWKRRAFMRLPHTFMLHQRRV